MRIASNFGAKMKSSFLGASAFVLVLCASSLSMPISAHAADAQAAPAPAPTLSPSPMAIAAATPGAEPVSAAANNGLPIPAMPGPTNSAPGAEMAKSISAMETKISDNAKAVVKGLDTSTDALTLEDLNSAKQTIARIDAIIDVEKRLGELEKLRNDRNGSKNNNTGTSFASAIPASALQPMPTAFKPMEIQPEREVVIKPPAPTVEISRIIGSEGVYSAVLKVNGDYKTVHVGDQFSGKSTVKSISPSAVMVEENGQYKTMHLKNVDAIFSAMR